MLFTITQHAIITTVRVSLFSYNAFPFNARLNLRQELYSLREISVLYQTNDGSYTDLRPRLPPTISIGPYLADHHRRDRSNAPSVLPIDLEKAEYQV